jgi:hypothetical protein
LHVAQLIFAVGAFRLYEARNRGRDVGKIGRVLLAMMLFSTVANIRARGQMTMGHAALGQATGDTLADPQTAFAGSPLACSEPQKLIIPKAIAKRAKLKARLVGLLRESLFDDSKGIVNLAREREIQDLATKLTRENER